MSDVRRSPKRWRRWLMMIALLFAVPWAAKRWLDGSMEDKARLVRLGQTQAEVVAILGEPEWSYSIPPSTAISGFVYGRFPAWWDEHVVSAIESKVLGGRRCPFPIGVTFDSFPVRVDFDADGRVNRIRIWGEEVSAAATLGKSSGPLDDVARREEVSPQG